MFLVDVCFITVDMIPSGIFCGYYLQFSKILYCTCCMQSSFCVFSFPSFCFLQAVLYPNSLVGFINEEVDSVGKFLSSLEEELSLQTCFYLSRIEVDVFAD